MRKSLLFFAPVCLLALAACGGGNKQPVKAPATEEVKDTVVAEVRDTFPADRWMEENKQKEGVKEANGIQYKVIQEGDGDKPSKRNRVKMNFELRLTNGKLIESHWGKDVVELPLTKVIPGLQNAVTQMPKGSTWEIYVPWQLGYGEEGSKGIPPHSALIFKVKLIDVIKL
jgi:FKBP-type peptidyl-prolyl cis-trans isomerase FklB